MEDFAASSKAMKVNIKTLLPANLKNRRKNMWTPMFKIAKAGGKTWWDRMVAASEYLHVDDDGIKKSTQLLIDLHDWFQKKAYEGDRFISSSLICTELATNYSEHGWDSYNFKSGEQITPMQFARLVGGYPQEKNIKIKPTKKWDKSLGKEIRGYYVHQFELAIKSYAMKHIIKAELREASIRPQGVEGVESDTYDSTDSTTQEKMGIYDKNNVLPFKKDQDQEEELW